MISQDEWARIRKEFEREIDQSIMGAIMASGTFQVGDRVTCNGRGLLGVGVVTAEENYGETLHVRWGNDKGSLPHARGSLTKCAGPLLASEYDTVNGQAVPVRRVW